MRVIRFETRVVPEGSNRGSRIAIPAGQAHFLPAPCWIRASFNAGAPVFLYARKPPSRATVDLTLPSWLPGRPQLGDLVNVEVEHAERFRARPETPLSGFDWLPYIDAEHYFPAEGPNGTLAVASRYEEPFVLRRVTEIEPTYRMLGLYQAEGSKSAQATDFSMANGSPELLRYVAELLGGWGIPHDRLALEVLHAVDESPTAAERHYSAVGAPIVATRLRPGPGAHAATLHVKKSTPLLRATRGVLARIFAGGFSTQEAARAYALGWLDGDGTITLLRNTGGIELRLAGYVDEQKVVLAALEQAFQWTLPATAFGTPRTSTHRTLRLDQAADLAAAGAFRFSMSRARLIWGLDQRLARTTQRYVQGRSLTTSAHYERARAVFDAYLHSEAARLLAHPLACTGFNTNTKGLPYPL